MSIEANKAVVRRFLEDGWSKGNLAVVHDVIGPTAVHPYFREYPPGPEGFRQSIIGPRTTFPDLQLSIDAMIAEGDTVTTRYTLSR